MTPTLAGYWNGVNLCELDNKTTFNNTYYTELTVNKIYGSLTQDQAYSNFMPIIAGRCV